MNHRTRADLVLGKAFEVSDGDYQVALDMVAEALREVERETWQAAIAGLQREQAYRRAYPDAPSDPLSELWSYYRTCLAASTGEDSK